MKHDQIILVAEDEFVKRVVLRGQLRRLGTLVEAASASEAVDKLDQLGREGRAPSVAVIDLQMTAPDGGIDPDAGFQVIQQLRVAFPRATAIVLTVRNDRDAWERAVGEQNVRYFFTKPWKSTDLQRAVKACRDGEARGLQCFGLVEGVGDA